MTTILVVDDEPQIARTLRINLTARGYDVITAPDGATALRAATDHKPDPARPRHLITEPGLGYRFET
jgi:two-component system, OmpR family, KDP operon response regulator KdpE